jgi:2-methylcitrate dehydratase PrpD
MSLRDLHTMVDEVTALDVIRVPGPVLAHTVDVIADTIAVIIGGARSPAMRALTALDEAEGLLSPASRPGNGHTATVLTAPTHRAHPAHAAFLNATAGTFLELDEGIRPTGHPAMHVVPAAFAAAESRHACGEELLRAVSVGYELTARLFGAVRFRPGVHPHGHLGAIGAAVAVATLDGTDPHAAAAIAATTPLLTSWQACYDGASTRNTFTGHAARTGVRASALARAGFTGSSDSLAASFAHISDPQERPGYTGALDYDNLAIAGNYFKVHSVCALAQGAIEAAVSLAPVDVARIKRVKVSTIAVNLKIDTQPVANELSTRFSLPYAVAAALRLGRGDPDAFEYHPEVAALATKVDVHVDDALDAQWPQAAPVEVSVVTESGTDVACVANPRGHHSRPLSRTELRDKFTALLKEPDRAIMLWERLAQLPTMSDCTELFAETRT